MKFLKNNKTFIVAEVGNNHEGNLSNAFKLIDAAKKSGVDAIKFQTYKAELFLSNNCSSESLIRAKKFELTEEDFYKISEYSKKKKLIFFSTPLDIKSAIFLNKIQKIFKISSGDNNFFDLINVIKSFNKPIIISTGMSDLDSVKKIIKFVKFNWFKQKEYLSILQCTTSYPVEMKQVNLSVISYYQKIFKNITVGYSDHTVGIQAAYLSVAFGAKIVEKHFTLSKSFSKFRDHALSADFNDMSDLVKNIRDVEKLIGSEIKKIQPSEKAFLKNARRSYALNKDMKKNQIVKKNDLVYLRPKIGITNKNSILGKYLRSDIYQKNIVFERNLKKND